MKLSTRAPLRLPASRRTLIPHRGAQNLWRTPSGLCTPGKYVVWQTTSCRQVDSDSVTATPGMGSIHPTFIRQNSHRFSQLLCTGGMWIPPFNFSLFRRLHACRGRQIWAASISNVTEINYGRSLTSLPCDRASRCGWIAWPVFTSVGLSKIWDT